MNVVVDGLMANYQKVGKGNKVLLMLHGWGDTSQTFSKLIEDLQDDYLIYTLDLPGFGGTQTPPNAWGLEDYANFINQWKTKIDLGKIFAVIGHSYGGATAIEAIGLGKITTSKLVLLASSGIRETAQARKSLLKAAAKLIKQPLRLLPASQQKKIKRKAYEAIGSDFKLLPHMELTYKRIIGEDVRPAAAKIKSRTLLIYGSQDKDAPVKYGEMLHSAIKNSRLEVIDAGHFLHQEGTDEVADLIKEFLESSDV